MAKGKEATLQKSIIDMLQQLGIAAFNNYCGPIIVGKGRMVENPNAGLPDIFGILPDGKFLMIEVKVPEYKKTHTTKKSKQRLEKQREWIRKCNELGAVGFFATSMNEVYDELMKRGYLEVPWIEKCQS